MYFRYQRGDQIILNRASDFGLIFGVITGCSSERGRTVYDFMDNWGSPRWCYEEEILFSLRQA